MRNRIAAWLLVAGVGLLPHGSSRAAEYIFEFGGPVMFTFGTLPPELSAVTAGMPWTLTYTFDSNATNTSSFPDIGMYGDAFLSYQAELGGAVVTPNFLAGIDVTNDATSGNGEDVYTVAGSVGLLTEPDFYNVGLTLSDSTGTIFDSVDLPTTLDLNDFDGEFGIDGFTIAGLDFTIIGDITLFNGMQVRGGLPGDTDGDNDIDDADLGTTISNFTGPVGGADGKTLGDGDTDDDGDIDDADLGTTISGFTGPLSAVRVPEPASILPLGLLVWFARRRRE